MDQAESLRRKIENKKLKKGLNTKVVAVLSGKGGVGKSVFSLNFALGLNKAGQKTLLIDLDIGMGNIDILLGLHGKRNIVDMIDDHLDIEQVINYHESGLAVLTGGSGLSTIFQLDGPKFNYFLEQLNRLKDSFDMIIFDLGAGMNQEILSFIKAVHEIILVTNTEPTALTDAYAVIKIANRYANDIPIQCIINRYDSEKEARETWLKLYRASEKFLGKELTLLGSLPRDNAVIKAVKSQQPFLVSAPRSKISIGINDIVSMYLRGITSKRAMTTMDSFITKLRFMFR